MGATRTGPGEVAPSGARRPDGHRSAAGGLQTVEEALRGFDPVTRPRLRWVVRNLWWIELALLPVNLVLFYWAGVRTLRNFLLLLGPHLPAAWAAFLARELFDRTGGVLARLWHRGVLAVRGTISGRPKGPRGDLAEAYRDYVSAFQGDLNRGPWWVVAGLITAFLFYLFFPADGYGWTLRIAAAGGHQVGFRSLFLLAFTVQIVAAFFLGVLGFRVGVIAYRVHKLGRDFDFKLQLQHLDRCGGLRPLGDLCFSIAAIWTIAAVYPTAWIIVFGLHGGVKSGLDLYFIAVLTMTFSLALLTFFRPLFQIHRAMVGQRPQFEAELDALSREAGKVAREIERAAGARDPATVDTLTKQFDALRLAQEKNAYIPLWPFDTRLFVKFVASQVIPLTGVTAWVPVLVQKLITHSG
jgi:hypothetical protein